MTASGSSDLAALLRRTRCLLLDFDGPICSIFAGRPARTIVRGLLNIVSSDGAFVPEPVLATSDPFDVLRFAATISHGLARRVEHALKVAEIEATHTAAPTPHAVDLIHSWPDAGHTIAVVSNNSAAAVQTYLARHEIDVGLVIGRTDADPAHLKPSPYLVARAIQGLNTDANVCTLVGDSVTDITAAREAGITSIGYANKLRKFQALTAAGADIVIDDMRALAHAAKSLPF